MQLLKDIKLSKFTTFRTGGRARYFIRISSVEDLKKAFNLSREKELPVFILGRGSNILVSDKGFHGLVIKNEIPGIEFENTPGRKVLVVAGAGENWDDIIDSAVSRGLSGLEPLSGIPGTVGASVVQNIGAYGLEAGARLVWAEVFDPKTFLTYRISRKDCRPGYRHSIFKTKEGKHLVVTRVCFELVEKKVLEKDFTDKKILSRIENFGDLDEITPYVLRQAVLDVRCNKLPLVQNVGTAGSFFKNPIVNVEILKELLENYRDVPYYSLDGGDFKIPAGWLIEKVAGFKGTRFRNAGVWDQHALIIVNYGDATSSEIKTLADTISARIKKRAGIDLEWEVDYIE